MKMVERHIVKNNSNIFSKLDDVCFLSKNLYNVGMYRVRKYFFETGNFLNYYNLEKCLKEENNIDYYALPTKVSQQTLKLVEKSFKSFFGLLKLKKTGKYNSPVKIPKYLEKEGRFVTVYTNQAISSKSLKQGYIKLSGVEGVFINTKQKQKDVQQVRILHKGSHIIVEVVYNVLEVEPKNNNNRYCSIDLGLNNLATVSGNVTSPFIINGKPIKSVNQFFNKKMAHYSSQLKIKNNKHKSKKIQRLFFKRNNKIDDYLHKASRYIINHLVSNNINTLVIGQNKEWKQEINIGKVNNQKFVQIPHSKLIHLLTYKAKLEGINVITHEESYTSKCSFLDGEEIKKHDKYKGKRIKRGLFRSSNGSLINADVNGSLNILRKVVGKFNYDPIEVCSAPTIITIVK